MSSKFFQAEDLAGMPVIFPTDDIIMVIKEGPEWRCYLKSHDPGYLVLTQAEVDQLLMRS